MQKTQRWTEGLGSFMLLLVCLLLAAWEKAQAAEPDVHACQILAAHANRGTAQELVVPPQQRLNVAAREARFGPVSPIDEGGDYWFVDLGGDATPEHVLLTTSGTMHAAAARVRSSSAHAAVEVLDAFDDALLDLQMLRIDGRHMLAALDTQGRYRRLWRIGAAGTLTALCSLSVDLRPQVRQSVGERNPICLALAQGDVRPPRFDAPHLLEPLRQVRWTSTPSHGASRMDIDNDGSLEHVVQLSMDSSAGRGCSLRTLGVTDASLSRLADSPLNALLAAANTSCGSTLDAFVHDGRTYLDANEDNGDRTVSRIERGRAVPVCRYQGRWVYRAMSAS